MWMEMGKERDAENAMCHATGTSLLDNEKSILTAEEERLETIEDQLRYIGEPILAADLVTLPNRSIITQSFDSRERLTPVGYLNADGFGVAWYAPEVATIDPTPCVFTSITPAWSNENLYNLSRKVISPLVFAHVRAATPGQGVNESNCHPFHFGRYVFMHNGEVGGIHQIRRAIMSNLSDHAFKFACQHSSDSGLAFAMFLNQLNDGMSIHTPDELRYMIENVIAQIREAQEDAGVKEMSLLNFVVSDGFSIVATRFVRDPKDPDASPASLYMAAGAKFEPVDQKKGEYRIVHSDRRNHLAIITSEPLTDDKTDWLPIKRNHVVVITEDLHVLSAPINEEPTSDDQISDITMCLERLVMRTNVVESGWLHSVSNVDHLANRLERQNSGNVYRTPNVRVVPSMTAVDACTHTLVGHKRTVLALALHPTEPYLFSASQDSTVRIWNTITHQCMAELRGHTAGVLSLVLTGDLLITASSDRTVRVWDIHSHQCIGIAKCRGTIFSVAMVGNSVYCGLQDTSVLRFVLDDIPEPGVITASMSCTRMVGAVVGQHCGFVFALCPVGEYLASGADDSTIKLWRLSDSSHAGTLVGHRGGVMALASDSPYELFSAGSDNTIKVWDMASLGCKRTIKGHYNDVLSLALRAGFIYSGDADGNIIVWNRINFTQTLILKGKQDGAIQCLLTDDSGQLYSGDSDSTIRVWETTEKICGVVKDNGNGERIPSHVQSIENALKEFVSIRTVSMDESLREECWRGAKYLCTMLEETGAVVTLVSMVEGKNPIILARIGNDPSKPTVVVYGHYDVQPANAHGWICDPWEATAINGYMYGRGVTDDKGPILATLFAIRELQEEGAMPVNVVFAYEGEEEQSKNASIGFHEAINSHMSMFADADLILVSNNYWITDSRPCLTYGMRGSINMEVRVDGPKEDLHAGVDGGVVVEPLSDLMAILANLVDSRGMVLIPGFYEDVREVTDKEIRLYDDLQFDISQYKSALGVKEVCHGTSSRDVLMARWRQPSLSVTGVHTSTKDTRFSIISKSATGEINIRYVPDQNGEQLTTAVKLHLAHEFNKRHSPNSMSVRVLQNAQWWLGDPDDLAFTAASAAVEEVWGVKPVFVREGGTMAITPFLVSALGCPALHLPLGQASDGAHLANERISLNNLHKGKDVIKKTFENLGKTLAHQKR